MGGGNEVGSRARVVVEFGPMLDRYERRGEVSYSLIHGCVSDLSSVLATGVHGDTGSKLDGPVPATYHRPVQ